LAGSRVGARTLPRMDAHPPATPEPDGADAHRAERTERARRCVPVDLRDYVEFDREEATRIRVLWTPQLALDLWCIEPMQATHILHYDDQDVTYTVVGGRSWFVTDEGEVGLDPMGALQVPAGVVHGIDNRAPDPLIVLATVSPPGDERPAAPVAHDAVAVRAHDDEPGPLGRAWRSLLGRTDG
jgi:quercetin dioxygenase-like cupin family protein